MTDRVAVREWLAGLQESLVEAIERADGAAASAATAGSARGGGGGESRVLKDGALIEQGGVNFSEVRAQASPPPPPRPAGARGRAVHRDGRLARAASAESARADDAPEPAVLHRGAGGR